MKINKLAVTLIALLICAASALPVLAAGEEGAVRAAMERAFGQLRAGDYAALYESLPNASRQRITRERFANGLQRARDSYGMEIDRLEMGAVHVGGDVATVDTVMYGHIAQPIAGAGKVVARQYLVRENGQWRIATTGSNSGVVPLLARNPKFARQYPPREPRIYLERNGRWIDVGSLNAMRRRAATR
ncbi:MAG: hypothetical protein ABR577_12925 [Pyrinomonadaceae bacterium]